MRRLVELLPDGQTEADWREMIVFQDFHRTPRADLDRFYRLFVQDFLARCPLSQTVRLRRGDVPTPGSLRFYVHTVECADRPPESMLVLALRGKTGLYVVQYAWRPAPPDAAALEAANVYLDRIRLCAAPEGSC